MGKIVHLKLNESLVHAVDFRMELDVRTSFAISGLQNFWIRQAGFIFDDRSPCFPYISYGTCVVPLLGFVVQRHWEIQFHEKEIFWKINCFFTSEGCTTKFSWKRGRLFDYTYASILHKICTGTEATVTNIKTEVKSMYPPSPLTSIELMKLASRYLNMKCTYTMEVAKSLHKCGFISYPRTAASKSLTAHIVKEILTEQHHSKWGMYAKKLMSQRDYHKVRKHGYAHPPIHPTKLFAEDSEVELSEDQLQLYNLVVCHFLASISEPVEVHEETVEVDIGGEIFYACETKIAKRGYLDLDAYPFEFPNEQMIPTYTMGQKLFPTKLTLESEETQPSPPLRE